MKHSVFFSCLLLLGVAVQSSAQAIKVSADRDTVALDDYLALTVHLENCDGNSFALPESINKNFTVMGRPMSQSSMSFVNGKMSSSATYTYYLAPKKAGKIEVSDITAKTSDGKTVKAEKLKLVAVEKYKGGKPKTHKESPSAAPRMATPKLPDFAPPRQEAPKPKRKTIQL